MSERIIETHPVQQSLERGPEWKRRTDEAFEGMKL
jgi:hypothetical protein